MSRIIIRVLAIATLIAIVYAESKADGIAIEPFATSYHFDRDRDYNEEHKYLGLVYRYDKFEFGIATMENSFNKKSNSFYVGFREPIYKEDDVEIGFFVDGGYKTGYKTNLLFFGGLYTEYKDFYIKLAVSPRLLGATAGYVFRFDGFE